MAQDAKLREATQKLMTVAGERALSSVADKVGAAAERLTDYALHDGGPGLMAAVTGSVGKESVKAALGDGKDKLNAGIAGGKEMLKRTAGGAGGGGKSAAKITNIFEQIDVGVPVRVAYDQWTQFTDFPKFMKKVESVEQESPEKLKWRAQVLWSHRDWESTITEQTPDRRIVWRSQGAKGYVDGAVTFHELDPELTRIVLVLEYHPQGFFEHTGNIWRAQGRRARLEFKHFARHVMTQSILHQDEIKGWRGEIHDGKVVEEDRAASTEEAASSEENAGEAAPEPRQRTESTDEEPAVKQERAGASAQSSREDSPRSPQENSQSSTSADEEAAEDEEPQEDEPAPRTAGKGRADAGESTEDEQARPRSLRREPRKRLSRADENTEE